MSLLATILQGSGSTTDNTVFTTGSFTPGANDLIIFCVAGVRGGSTNPTVPTITDSVGLTWTDISEFLPLTTGVNRLRMSVFAAQAGASPPAMTVTATYGATLTACVWQWATVSGSDVANGVLQSILNIVTTVADSANANNLSITLAAASDSNNRPFLFATHTSNEVTTPRTNWTELGDAGVASPAFASQSQWRSDTFETTATASWSTSSIFGGIAFEIKNAVVGGGSAVKTVDGLAITSVKTKNGVTAPKTYNGLA